MNEWVAVIVVVLFLWGFAEATVWPILPDLALFLVVQFEPDLALVALPAVAAGSAAGGTVGITLLRNGRAYPRPFTTARMEQATRQWLTRGPGGLFYQLATAVPYKVFVAEAAVRGFRRSTWAALTLLFRGARLALVTGLALGTDLLVRSLEPGSPGEAKATVAAVAIALFVAMWRIAWLVWSRPVTDRSNDPVPNGAGNPRVN